MGCGWLRASEPITSPAAHSGIQNHDSSGRPRLSLIERAAAPQAAAALAVAHDLGAAASAALGSLLEARLNAVGFPSAQVEAFASGFVLRSPLGQPTDAARFVQAARQVVLAPVVAGDPALGAVASRVSGLGAHRDDLLAALSACTGELAIPMRAAVPDYRSPAAVAQLERWRSQIIGPAHSALAVVGPAAVLQRASEAHAALPIEADLSRAVDAWPRAEPVAVADAAVVGSLSVALRVPSAAKAVEAAEALLAEGSALRQRLDPLGNASVERITGTTRPEGGCVAVSLRVEPAAESGPGTQSAASLAALVEQELRLAVDAAPGQSWSLDASVLRPGDPREVAARAAWRALTADGAGPIKRFVTYRPALGSSDQALSTASIALRQRETRSVPLRVASQVEPGQTEQHILLGAPCAPSDEDLATAGSAALWAETVARQQAERGDPSLQITPWISGQGVGLMLRAHPRSAQESADALTVRAASALGAAVTRSLSAHVVVAQRASLLVDLGETPDPGWSVLLKAGAGEHPSWFDPRGSWDSINQLNTSDVERRRELLLRGPWRVAVLSGSPNAAGYAQRELTRWLWPYVDPNAKCPAPPSSLAKPGLYRVATSEPAQLQANAWIWVPITHPARDHAAAERTVLLLNRARGWLEAALHPAQIAASAQARLLGGERSAAIAIGIQAEPEQVEPAVAQLRALLERLARGAMTRAEFDLSDRYFALRDQDRAFDPMFRAAALWLGPAANVAAPTFAQLKAFQRNLEPSRHVVVITTKRE